MSCIHSFQGFSRAIAPAINISENGITPIYYSSDKNSQLSGPQLDFIQQNIKQLEIFYDFNKFADRKKWKIAGSGRSKIALTHPNFPGMVFKIPRFVNCGYRNRGPGEKDLIGHYNNLRLMKQLSKDFEHIILPQCFLYPTKKGFILIEENLTFVNGDLADKKVKQELKKELYDFQLLTGLCDLYLDFNRNAGFLDINDSSRKIGIIDFDCNLNDYPNNRISSPFRDDLSLNNDTINNNTFANMLGTVIALKILFPKNSKLVLGVAITMAAQQSEFLKAFLGLSILTSIAFLVIKLAVLAKNQLQMHYMKN